MRNLTLSIVLVCLVTLACGFAVSALDKPPAAIDLGYCQKAIESGVLKPEDADALTRYVKDNPQDVRGHMLLARHLEQNGYLALAAEQFEKAWNLKKTDAEALVRLTNLKLTSGQKAAARQLTDMAIDSLSNDYFAMVQMGLLMHSHDCCDEAERLYTCAAKIRPLSPELACGLACVKISKGKFAEALALTDEGLSEPGSRFTALILRGQALAGLGRFDEAAGVFKEACATNPWVVDVDEQYMKALMHGGHFAEALEPGLRTLAVKGDKLNRAVRVDLMMMLTECSPGRTKEIVDKLSKELRESPAAQRFCFRYSVGDLFDEMGRHELAIEQYRAGIAENKNDLRCYLRLGKDLELWHRDLKGALENYRKAVALNPYDLETVARFDRLLGRMNASKNDIAGRLKNWLFSAQSLSTPAASRTVYPSGPYQ